MEESVNRMVVAGVLVFDRPVSMKQIRGLLERRLLRFSRFRQRVVVPFGGVGLLSWEDDPQFSIDHHLVGARLPAPRDEAALQAFTSDLASRPFAKGRPPWRFHFVPHFQGGSALVVRLHHCIGDGLALVHVLLSMADGAPEPPAPTRQDGDLEGLWESVQALPRRVGEDVLALLKHPDRMVRSSGEVANHLGSLVRLLLLPPDPATSFKGKLGKKKKLIWSRPFDLDDFKAMGRATGTTVNDILMAALSGSLRRYLLAHGAVPQKLDIRGVVPVNLRPASEAHLLGNRFGLVFLSLPLGVEDTLARLEEVRQRMQALKKSPDAAATFELLWAMGLMPRPLFDLVVDLFATKATTVVTNVVGPKEPISLLGVRLRQAMFWVPCAGHLGLGVSLLSYAGRVWMGVQTDVGLIPDPERILTGFEEEMNALRGGGRRPDPKQRSHRARRPPRRTVGRRGV
jgi:WS/DGAT/MGAT family acyltransferase